MNHRQQLFANTYLRHNDPTIAYMEAYKPKVPNYRAIMSAANRLLRKPEIAEYISSVRDSVRSQVEYELKEQMKEELLTIHEKRLYIKRVINGEILIPQDYKTTGCNRCTMFIRPTFPQILGYLKEDSRLAGHYPDKRRSSTKIKGSFPVFREGGTNEESDGRVDDDSTQSQIEETSTRQQKTTTERSELVVTIEKDINPTTTDNKKSTSDTVSPRKLSRYKREGDRGILAPDTREQQQKTTTEPQKSTLDTVSPLQGDRGTLAPIPRKQQQMTTKPTSHAGLRKLLNKQRERRNGVIGRDTQPRNPYPNPSKQALIASKSGTSLAFSSTSA